MAVAHVASVHTMQTQHLRKSKGKLVKMSKSQKEIHIHSVHDENLTFNISLI